MLFYDVTLNDLIGPLHDLTSLIFFKVVIHALSTHRLLYDREKFTANSMGVFGVDCNYFSKCSGP